MMAREKEDYRENIEQLNRLFPEREMLTLPETMQILGYGSRNTVKKHLGAKIVNGRISKAAIARYMCG
ncbi:MAG: hypothetical protein E7448_04390 [Ruminococcaceae bacterium]|nr:hypothetical protein [Oscillospiraceae bacterium]